MRWREFLKAGVAVAFLMAGPSALAEQAPAAAEAQAPAPAAPAARVRPELPPELREVLDRLDEANAELVDVRAKVTYTRLIPLLDNKRKSKGSLVFKKPDRLVMKLGRPDNEEVRTNGRLWWVVSHNDKQVDIYEAAAEGQGSREAAFLSIGYGQSSEELLEDYDVELLDATQTEGDEGKVTAYRIKFTPVGRPDQPPRYEFIEAEVADDVWLPRLLVLYERDGTIVHTYALSRMKVNTDVEDDEFEYEPPRGYNVVRLDEP